MSTVFETLKRILIEQGIDGERIAPEASLKDDLSLDSLDQTELMMALEEKFGGEISDEDAQQLLTVRDIVQFIEGRSAVEMS